jgi:hypothetical protein
MERSSIKYVLIDLVLTLTSTILGSVIAAISSKVLGASDFWTGWWSAVGAYLFYQIYEHIKLIFLNK